MAKQLKQPLIKIRWLQISLIGALVSAVFLAWFGVKLYQAHAYHRALDSQAFGQSDLLGSQQIPQTLFAKAVFLSRSGRVDEALATYASVIAKTADDEKLHRAAYYNSGNLYLKQAMEKLEKEGLPGWDVAGPLVALAKESYQKALRSNPQWSEAKYNYQLALRLAPSTYGMSRPKIYQDENLKQEDKPTGWPAMPGNPRGMP